MAADKKKLEKLAEELRAAQEAYDEELAEHRRVRAEVNPIFDQTSGKTYWEISCPKHRKDPFLVVPNGVGTGFMVAVASGSVPKALKGNWTRSTSLIKEVVHHMEHVMRPTLKSEKISKKDS